MDNPEWEAIRHFAEKALAVKEDRYDKWEKGKNKIPVEIVKKLKTKFGVTFEWIYDGDPRGLPHSLALSAQEELRRVS